MSRRTVIIRSHTDRAMIARWAANVEPGTSVEFRSKSRSTDQNALLWVLLAHIAKQVEWYGVFLSSEDWKDVLTASLRKARVVPGIDPGTFVPLGMRTSQMSVAEMNALIELIYAFGAERGVNFHDEHRSAA